MAKDEEVAACCAGESNPPSILFDVDGAAIIDVGIAELKEMCGRFLSSFEGKTLAVLINTGEKGRLCKLDILLSDTCIL